MYSLSQDKKGFTVNSNVIELFQYVPCDSTDAIRESFFISKQRPSMFVVDQLHQCVILASTDEFFHAFECNAVKKQNKTKRRQLTFTARPLKDESKDQLS